MAVSSANVTFTADALRDATMDATLLDSCGCSVRMWRCHGADRVEVEGRSKTDLVELNVRLDAARLKLRS